jgi:hypothetical protein
MAATMMATTASDPTSAPTITPAWWSWEIPPDVAAGDELLIAIGLLESDGMMPTCEFESLKAELASASTEEGVSTLKMCQL